jgi:hypothetical protein
MAGWKTTLRQAGSLPLRSDDFQASWQLAATAWRFLKSFLFLRAWVFAACGWRAIMEVEDVEDGDAQALAGESTGGEAGRQSEGGAKEFAAAHCSRHVWTSVAQNTENFGLLWENAGEMSGFGTVAVV